MPIYVYRCDGGHTKTEYRKVAYKKPRRKRCEKCGLYFYRDYSAEHSKVPIIQNMDRGTEPLSHLLRKRSVEGVLVENLTPEPVFVRSEAEYKKLLRDTKSKEVKGHYDH